MPRYDYVIGTGWWCGAEAEARVEGRPYNGSDLIRSPEFHHLWSAAVDGLTRPQAVFMVDSASRRRPPITNPRYEIMHLLRNPGHATVHTGHYCGWTASVIHSIEYALSADADYLVYIEQDALIFGEGILEFCIGKMRKPFMFGSGAGTPQPIQQSFFIIRKDGMRAFLAGLHRIASRDAVVCPEWKFVLAALGLHGGLIERLLATVRGRALLQKSLGVLIQSMAYDVLPIGFGRSRPLDFHRDHGYFQHGSVAEVSAYLRILPGPIREAALERWPALAMLAQEETGRPELVSRTA
jgi:hypothetical protein